MDGSGSASLIYGIDIGNQASRPTSSGSNGVDKDNTNTNTNKFIIRNKAHTCMRAGNNDKAQVTFRLIYCLNTRYIRYLVERLCGFVVET